MEGKRRLPVWMLGTSNKNSKPVDLDENDEVCVVTESKKPKVKRGISNREGKSFLVKCETKRKKRGFDVKDAIESSERDQEVVVVEKRKRGRVERKVEERECFRKAKEEESEIECSIENEDSSCGEEDDDELTMEDLLSIAKEFVEKDKSETGQQKALKGQCETKIKSSVASSSVTKTSTIAPKETTPPIHEETVAFHNSIENTSKVTVANYKTTEDPAQDMLDLFFGSLLKKPVEKEATTSIKDVIISNDIKNPQHDAIISNKPISFAKKKSSLRDAVAMLLDWELLV